MTQTQLPGTAIESLPLFSGTCQREPERKEATAQATGQMGFFSCPVCRDTGTIKDGGKVKRCWCQKG